AKSCAVPTLDGAHLMPGADLLPAGADDGLVAAQPFHHFGATAQTLADADLPALDLAIHHQIDEQQLAHGHHRFLRNHQGLRALGEDHRDLDELAGLEPVVGVGHLGADGLAAADLVQARVAGNDPALEALAGVGVQRQLDALADPYLADRLLRHAEIDLERVEHLQVDDVVAGAKVVAEA